MSDDFQHRSPERAETQRRANMLGYVLVVPGVVAPGVVFAIEFGCEWMKIPPPSDQVFTWIKIAGWLAGGIWIACILKRYAMLTGKRWSSLKAVGVFLIVAFLNASVALELLILGYFLFGRSI